MNWSFFDVRPVILHKLVRMEHVAADLAAEARVLDLTALASQLGLAALELVLGQPALEDAHGRLAVGEL